MDAPHIYVYIEKSLDYSIFGTCWIPETAKFICAGQRPNATGLIQIYELSSGQLELVSQHSKSKGIKCGSFGASPASAHHFATGDYSGQLDIWDISRADGTTPAASIYSARAHGSIINCIDGVGGLNVGKGAPEIVTGSKDGTVKLWDPRQKDKPVLVMEPDEGQQKRDCWTVAFGDTYSSNERCVVSGYDNGDIKMFDLRLVSCVWETNVGNGVCCLEFDRKDIEMNKLVATSLEGTVKVYDMRTRHKEKGYASLTHKAHGNSTVWQVRHLPQNRDVFVTTGGSGNITLWKYHYPSSRSRKSPGDGGVEGVAGTVDEVQSSTVSTQPVITWDWCRDKEGLAVTAAIDQTVRVLLVTRTNTL